MNEWEYFKVGSASDNPNWTNTDCMEFEDVYHVTHLQHCLNIIDDGYIRAGLIFDKSILNKERILVSWLSPNDWNGAGGYRYGNVLFSFNFRKTVTNKNYYWVESIAYGVKACRILVTDKIYHTLAKYDPESGSGPWWYNNNRDYRNGNYCLEFMIEHDLHLTACREIKMVKHHPSYCNISPQYCKDKSLTDKEGGALFLAGIASHCDIFAYHILLKDPVDKFLYYQYDKSLLQLFSELKILYKRRKTISIYSDRHATSEYLARSILYWYFKRDKTACKHLLNLFKTWEDASMSISRIIASILSISNIDEVYNYSKGLAT